MFKKRTADMTSLPIRRLRTDEITGTYWTPPTTATLAEIHPRLMAIVIVKADSRDWQLYSANVFDMESGGPIGYFEIARDPAGGRACGLFSEIGSQDAAPVPIWFDCSEDIDATARAFHRILIAAGHVL